MLELKNKMQLKSDDAEATLVTGASEGNIHIVTQCVNVSSIVV